MDDMNPHRKTVASGHENHGLHVCHKCGWSFPKPHPSARQRRAHKRVCGTIQGEQLSDGSTQKDDNKDDGTHKSVSDGEQLSDEDLKTPSPKVVESNVIEATSSGNIDGRSEDESFLDAVEQFPDAGSNPSAEEHLQEKNISETDLSTRHVIQDTAISGSHQMQVTNDLKEHKEEYLDRHAILEPSSETKDKDLDGSENKVLAEEEMATPELNAGSSESFAPLDCSNNLSEKTLADSSTVIDDASYQFASEQINQAANHGDQSKGINGNGHVAGIERGEGDREESLVSEKTPREAASSISKSQVVADDRMDDSVRTPQGLQAANHGDQREGITETSHTVGIERGEGDREESVAIEKMSPQATSNISKPRVVCDEDIMDGFVRSSQELQVAIHGDESDGVTEKCHIGSIESTEGDPGDKTNTEPASSLAMDKTNTEPASSLAMDKTTTEPASNISGSQVVADDRINDFVRSSQELDEESLRSISERLAHGVQLECLEGAGRDSVDPNNGVDFQRQEKFSEEPMAEEAVIDEETLQNISKSHFADGVQGECVPGTGLNVIAVNHGVGVQPPKKIFENPVGKDLLISPIDDTESSMQSSDAFQENYFRGFGFFSENLQKDVADNLIMQQTGVSVVDVAGGVVKDPFILPVNSSGSSIQHSDAVENNSSREVLISTQSLQEPAVDAAFSIHSSDAVKNSSREFVVSSDSLQKAGDKNVIIGQEGGGPAVDAEGGIVKEPVLLNLLVDDGSSSLQSSDAVEDKQQLGVSAVDTTEPIAEKPLVLPADATVFSFQYSDIVEDKCDKEIVTNSQLTEDDDNIIIKQQVGVTTVDAPVDSSSQADSLEGNWGSVSVLSNLSDAPAGVDNDSQPSKFNSKQRNSDSRESQKSDAFEPPSFMTLVEPKSGAPQKSDTNGTPKSASIQAGWFPSLTHVTNESEGRKKNEEIISRVTNWSAGKQQHAPLKTLLGEANKENKAKSLKLKDKPAPMTHNTVSHILSSEGPLTHHEKRENGKQRNSPARYQTHGKSEKTKVKGKPYWAQFVCCSSVN